MPEYLDNGERFDALVASGKLLRFHGVDNNCFRLGKEVFEAVEDENDGYRSSLDNVRLRDDSSLTFFRTSITKVCAVDVDGTSDGDSFRGWRLVDTSGHVWLEFGTENYYPCFIFRYTPKAV